MSLKTTIYSLLLTLLCIESSWSNTQNINPLITYRCDIESDIIIITNSLLSPEEAKSYDFDDVSGTYNPWNLVTVDQHNNKVSRNSNSKIIKKCTLSSGEYTTTIEPKIFSADMSSACGQSISGTITIEYDGFELFEKRAFENFCLGNAPIITRISVFGKTSEVKVKQTPKYKFY